MKYQMCQYKKQQGAALLAAIIILTIIAFTGVTVARLTTHTQQDSIIFTDKSQSKLNSDAPLLLAEKALNAETIIRTRAIINGIAPVSPISIDRLPENRWWHDETLWTINKKSLTGLPGNPDLVIEDMGNDLGPMITTKPRAVMTVYRVTTRARGTIESADTRDTSESIIQTHIGIYE